MANHARRAGHVSATTKVSIPTAATSLIPVPTRNDRNDPTPTTSACPIRSRSFSSSPATAPTNGPHHDTDQAAHEQARDHAHRGADHSGPCAAEQFGHVPRQKIIRRSHRGRQPRPQPHLGGRQRRIAARIGAKKAPHSSAQGRAGRGQCNPRCRRGNRGKPLWRGIRPSRSVFIVPRQPVRPPHLFYSTRRLVAVSGKTTHGRNVFASSNSMRA